VHSCHGYVEPVCQPACLVGLEGARGVPSPGWRWVVVQRPACGVCRIMCSLVQVLPLWVLEAVPPEAEPLSVLSSGLVGVRGWVKVTAYHAPMHIEDRRSQPHRCICCRRQVFALGALATFVRNSMVHIAGERIAARCGHQRVTVVF
jgi:hypothetical protein